MIHFNLDEILRFVRRSFLARRVYFCTKSFDLFFFAAIFVYHDPHFSKIKFSKFKSSTLFLVLSGHLFEPSNTSMTALNDGLHETSTVKVPYLERQSIFAIHVQVHIIITSKPHPTQPFFWRCTTTGETSILLLHPPCFLFKL